MSVNHTSAGAVFRWLVAVGVLLGSTTLIQGQVSPTQIASPQARAAEEKYLPQLSSLSQLIASTKLECPFTLARYLHAKPGQQAALDHNGIEFVDYGGRVILKVSGVCKLAFDVGQRSTNERAERVLTTAVLPILKLVEQQIPQSEDYDGLGFEILYEKRRSDSSYDYQGKEILTVIFRPEDAAEYFKATGVAERQRLLNRSDIFINGEEFGLALHQRDPVIAATLERFVSRRRRKVDSSEDPLNSAVQVASYSTAFGKHRQGDVSKSSSGPNFADAVRLQKEFQSQLNALMSDGATRFHLDDDSPPSFEVSGDQMQLHLTLRNEKSFDRNGSSIYRRAAQSFDLLLAPELRGLSRNLLSNDDFDALDFSVVNQFGVSLPGTETIDYICPVKTLREFVANQITNQELINRSVVLVNGERISLNLQLVE